jgi:acetylglutamate/LysW-gamma-L-alpha-aminoadipate kinase
VLKERRIDVIVVKVGGGASVDLGVVCADVAALARDRAHVAFVHGGSHATNLVAEQLGHPPRFVTSPSGYVSRRTDRRALEIFEMVYCGRINKGIVERLARLGARPIGLAGLDGRIWEGPRKRSIRVVENGRVRMLHDDYTGIVERVNTSLLETLIHSGYLPVLTPPAISYDGEAINVDGDRASAATAAALGAGTLVILSDVPGLLRDAADEGTLIPRVDRREIAAALEHASGRMRTKLLGAREAIEGGVARVVLGDARVAEPVRRALEGKGTVIA